MYRISVEACRVPEGRLNDKYQKIRECEDREKNIHGLKHSILDYLKLLQVSLYTPEREWQQPSKLVLARLQFSKGQHLTNHRQSDLPQNLHPVRWKPSVLVVEDRGRTVPPVSSTFWSQSPCPFRAWRHIFQRPPCGPRFQSLWSVIERRS